MSYKSPIDICITQLRIDREKAVEEQVFRAVQGIKVDVNKEELIRALRYDRDQYDNGYKDGYDDGYDRNTFNIAQEIYTALHNEIIDAINCNYNVIKEREEKHKVNRYEDDFCQYCNGKIHALEGILYFMDELMDKYTNESEE